MKKRLFFLLAITLMFLITGLSVYAEKTVIQDLVDNPDATTLVVRVTWETGKLSVTLLTPSGKRVPLTEGTPDTKVTLKETSLEATIYSPEQGKWQIEFTGGGNGTVRAETTKIIEPLRIIDLKASQVAGGNDIQVSFSSAGDRQADSFNYEIYLIADAKDMDGKLLTTGSSRLGNSENLTLSLNQVNSFSQYYLRMNATIDANGVYDFTSEVSPTFGFTQFNDLPQVAGLDTSLNPTDRTMSLTWEALSQDAYYDGYRVCLYKDDEIVPYDSEDLSIETLQVYKAYPSEAKKIRVEVSAVSRGITGQPASSEIDLSILTEEPVIFEIPSDKVVAQRDFRLPYKVKKPADLTVVVNDRESSYPISADGVLSLKLDEGKNSILLKTSVAGNIALSKEFELILDVTPPQLSIYEDIDGIKVSDSQIAVLGNSEPSAVVSVNGQNVSFDERGDFIYETPLNMGKNTIRVLARDGAGNISEYSATVERIFDLNKTFYVLIGGLVISLVLLFIYWRKGRKT